MNKLLKKVEIKCCHINAIKVREFLFQANKEEHKGNSGSVAKLAY